MTKVMDKKSKVTKKDAFKAKDEGNRRGELKVSEKRREKSNDVDDGKTVFVRNLSFETTQEALRLFMSNIAPVEYCLLCKDKDANQSKGSAFVKFKKVEDADRVVTMDQGQLILDGRLVFLIFNSFFSSSAPITRKLRIDHALPRNVVQKNNDLKDRDKRNLYLAREGLIYAGSPAAEGVSKGDLEKRLALEGKKRILLQKLTNFVSRTRLCVHNVPTDYDNIKLKKLFKDCVEGSPRVKITECRIIRNRNASGKLGGSKGFAFVEFERHEHALKALRKLNNNPDVFTDIRRPIVEFAIEDKLALNKRMRQRLKNEQAKNKKERKSPATLDKEGACSNQSERIVAPKTKEAVKRADVNTQNGDDGHKVPDEESFTGFIAAPLKLSEPVVAPKLNRKLGEAKKKIAESVRQKKFEEKKVKTKKDHLSKRQLKLERRKEAKLLDTRKKIPKEFDDFEEDFVKKSGARALVDDRNEMMEIPAKKVKWFRDE